MLKKLTLTVITAAALTGCVTTTPQPTDTAAPPTAPAMSCDVAQSLVNDALDTDSDTASGPEIRRRVLGAGAVILANSECFSSEMIGTALESFNHEGLSPEAYGYSD